MIQIKIANFWQREESNDEYNVDCATFRLISEYNIVW